MDADRGSRFDAYLHAYAAVNGRPIELEPMVASILHAFIEADRGFQAWRKAQAAPKPEAGANAGAV